MLGSSLFVCTTLNGARWRGVRKEVTKNWWNSSTHPPDLTSWCSVTKTVVRIMGIFVRGISWKQQLLVLTQLRKEIEKECLIWPSLKGINGITLPETDKKSPCIPWWLEDDSASFLGQVRPIFCPKHWSWPVVSWPGSCFFILFGGWKKTYFSIWWFPSS